MTLGLGSLLRFGRYNAVSVEGQSHRLGFFGIVPRTLCRRYWWRSSGSVPVIEQRDTVGCQDCQGAEATRGLDIKMASDKRWWPGGRGAHAHVRAA
jgi:hypothetical protein